MAACFKATLLAYHQYPFLYPSFSAELLSSQSALSVYWCLGLFLPRSGTAFPVVKFCEVPVGPFLWPGEVPLNGTTLWHISLSFQFCIISKLAECAFCPITCLTEEDD